MQEYVVGFAFDNMGRVALIRKNRPEWQAGRYNGIGGHVETGESPEAAMVREFEEETGVCLDGWQKFVVMDFPGARVHFYRAYADFKILGEVRTLTDEPVGLYRANYLPSKCIPNLKWLIPLGAYTADNYECIHVQASVAEILGGAK